MTKMRKPEMAVIRFAESDVIVASSRLMSASVNLTGFSGGVPGDGQVKFLYTILMLLGITVQKT